MRSRENDMAVSQNVPTARSDPPPHHDRPPRQSHKHKSRRLDTEHCIPQNQSHAQKIGTTVPLGKPFSHLSVTKGMTFSSGLPTKIVSNEEFAPFPQTPAQARVEHMADRLVEQSAARCGLTRRKFLQTSGAMAAGLLAMNSVFGRFFDIGDVELFETSAFAEQQGAPYFIFDVKKHYVGSQYDPRDEEEHRKGAVSKQALLSLRKHIRETGLNPKLAADTGAIDDLSWKNFVKEV